jgi:hypothetical protein
LDYEYLLNLKQNHPALRLLAADNAPLIVSFLYQQFVKSNQRSIRYSDLISQLDDYLYFLRDLYGEEKYPKTARQYLEDWADERSLFLRKYYTAHSDEPELDLTPATEKVIEWLQELQEREFVGTESRLMTVFQLLREIVHQMEEDPQARIKELERRKAVIDREIEQVRAGRIETLDETQVRERFFQAEETARRLLADFRQVEYNFRELDRQTRERIALSDRPKGEMLDEIFHGQDQIRGSDQGRSFRAFWEFLMSPQRQGELDQLLARVFALESIQQVEPGELLKQIRYALLEAGEKVYRTNNTLVEQLRKYLDDQAWLENKRIMELIKGIERKAVAIKEQPPQEATFMTLDEPRPGIALVMSRSLFTPPSNPVIAVDEVTEGEGDVAVDALFQSHYVDEEELAANVRRLLQRRSQVSLSEVVRRYPVTKGVAELVAYVNLAVKDEGALIDEQVEERLEVRGEQGHRRQVRLPRVVFTREMGQ